MAANITVIRGNVRKDLHDEDSSNYRWTDAVLDRHIEHGRRVERTGKDINEPEIGNLDAGDRDTEAGGASMEGSSPGIFADGSHDEAPGSHGETLLSDRLYVLFDRSLNGVPLVPWTGTRRLRGYE